MKVTNKIQAAICLLIIMASGLKASTNLNSFQKIFIGGILTTAAGTAGYQIGIDAKLQPGKIYTISHSDTNINRTFQFDPTGKITVSSQLKDTKIWHPNNYTGKTGNQIIIDGKHIVATNFFQPNTFNENTALTVEIFRQTNVNENQKSPTFTTISQNEHKNFVKKDNSRCNPYNTLINFLSIQQKNNSYTSEDIAFEFAEKGNAAKIHEHLQSVESNKQDPQ